MADKFTYDFQLSGYKFDQYDEKGSVEYSKFLEEFKSFPWLDQIGKINGGTEPTITVKNLTNGTDYWVSIIGSPIEYAYLVGIVYPKEVKSFLGLGKTKKIRWVEIFVAEEARTVEDTFSTFFEGQHSLLLKKLSELPKFDEMEAQN